MTKPAKSRQKKKKKILLTETCIYRRNLQKKIPLLFLPRITRVCFCISPTPHFKVKFALLLAFKKKPQNTLVFCRAALPHGSSGVKPPFSHVGGQYQGDTTFPATTLNFLPPGQILGVTIQFWVKICTF